MTPPGGPAWGARRVRLGLAAVAAAFLASAVPASLRLGANAEEMVGLLDRPVEHLRPDGRDAAPGPGLHAAHDLPVWGYVTAAGRYLPIMIDGHVGALAFYPSRAAVAVGGLAGGRLLSVLYGVLTLLLVFTLAWHLAGERVAWAAAALCALSPHFVFAHMMVRPDEQLDYLAHLAALAAAVRYVATRRLGWCYLGCFLFGLGLAAKNTAAWTLCALGAATLLCRLIPRVDPRAWVPAVVCFLLPLAPQLAYLGSADAAAFQSRLGVIANPLHSLRPAALAASAHSFATGVGHMGLLIARLVGGQEGPLLVVPLAGWLPLAALLLLAAAALRRRTPAGVRAVGVGGFLLLLLHFALYYRGEIHFLLFTPWVPLALALAGHLVWTRAGAARVPLLRHAGRGAVVGCAALLLASYGLELYRIQGAVAAPATALFDRRAQEALVHDLVTAGRDRPYTTTYGQVGMLDVLSRGALRPRDLFPYFAQVHRDGPTAVTHRRAWEEALDRLGPGVHTVVLAVRPSRLDTNPCPQGDRIATELRPAVLTRGGSVRALHRYRSRAGAVILELVEVTLPARAAG